MPRRRKRKSEQVEYVPLGPTGMEVSRLGLGSMTFGSKMSRSDSARVVDEALERGVNFIDTADSYGPGEETLGEILSGGKREQVYLASKVFRTHGRGLAVGRNSRVNIMNALERSLRLLRTDYLDLYQLHHPDPQTPIDESMETLNDAVRQGKVRYVGVSNHYAWMMGYMLGLAKGRGWPGIVSYQANYNLLERQIEAEAVPLCRRFGLGLMVYSPLCGGVLTGKYKSVDDIPEGSRATYQTSWQNYLRDEASMSVVQEVEAVAKETGYGMNQVAIMWLLSKPYVTQVLMGGTKPEHFWPILDIALERLPDETIERLDKASAQRINVGYWNQGVKEGFGLAPGR